MRPWLALLGLALVAAAASPAKALGLTITAPASGASVGDDVPVTATITSAYDISATATIAGRTVPLTAAGSTFTGTLSLAGLPTGQVTLVVNASDTSGATQQASEPLVYAPIHLVLTSPEIGGVAQPTMHVSGTCDQAGNPCPSLEIVANTGHAVLSTLTNVTSFDVVVDVHAPWEGGGIIDGSYAWLDVTATDGSLSASVTRKFAVDSSPYLVPYMHVPGYIHDVDATRVLFDRGYEIGDNNGVYQMSLFHADTGVTEDLGITDHIGYPWGSFHGNVHEAWLTPRGAVWTSHHIGESFHLLEWRDGVAIDHGVSLSEISVAGSYVAYFAPDGLERLDVDTGAIVTVAPFSSVAANWSSFAVTADGAMVWTEAGGAANKVRFWSGSTPAIDVGDGGMPSTDGALVSWSSGNPNVCPAWVRLADGTVEELFDTQMPCTQMLPPEVFGGTVGFARPNTNGVNQAWLRHADGSRTQLTAFLNGPGVTLTYFADDSVAIAGTDGTSIQRYDGTVVPVSTHALRMFRRNGAWFPVIAGQVFTIDGSPPPPPVDAGVPDATAPLDATGWGDAARTPDASAVPDGPPAAASPDAGSNAAGATGCGCHSSRREDSLPVALAMVLVMWRRRRRVRPHSHA